MAFNDPDRPPRVAIDERAVTDVSDHLALAPCSVTLFMWETE
jgi:hypothetical protein